MLNPGVNLSNPYPSSQNIPSAYSSTASPSNRSWKSPIPSSSPSSPSPRFTPFREARRLRLLTLFLPFSASAFPCSSTAFAASCARGSGLVQASRGASPVAVAEVAAAVVASLSVFLFRRWYCRCARRWARRWQRWEQYFVRAALSRLGEWQKVQSVGADWRGG